MQEQENEEAIKVNEELSKLEARIEFKQRDFANVVTEEPQLIATDEIIVPSSGQMPEFCAEEYSSDDQTEEVEQKKRQ